jgi:hypothetical protein
MIRERPRGFSSRPVKNATVLYGITGAGPVGKMLQAAIGAQGGQAALTRADFVIEAGL